MSSPRYICIHGHFYQPVREDPWTGRVPLAPGAYPYHDWNEKITAECYGANAWSQLRDPHGRVSEIVSNYEHISFNLGPTLFSWLALHAPDVYSAILAADKASQSRFSGHGSAMAQCYNHMIMPLANRRDKQTQVIWGIRDFRYRFHRDPEGMWLSETAVDLETLEVMAEQEIAFTILAPRQIAFTRKFADPEWTDHAKEPIDPHHPYLVRLPSGRSIIVFAYDGAIAREVAFEKLLSSGDQFAGRLLSAFADDRRSPQLVHIATDGETYGHHHPFGDMALAYALKTIEKHSGVRLTNYSEYLHLHPPTHEARIVENSSWSCAHGIERWRSDCGCSIVVHPGWNQKWRKPMRDAFDWLRDEINPRFEAKAMELFKDPWAARDEFVQFLLDHSADAEKEFFARHQAKRLSPKARGEARELLHMQRHMMLMYSSCGWFFEDISGVEARILLRQSGRVISVARELLGIDLLGGSVERLREARSNDPEVGDGARVLAEECPGL